MSVPKTQQVWILNERPTDAIKADTFKLEQKAVPQESELKDGEVLLKVIALSNDPAQRTWMDDDYKPERMYAPPIFKGEAIKAGILGEVVATKSQKFKKGDRITGGGEWAEYVVVKDDAFGVAEAATIEGQSEFISLSALGLTGKTAWMGAFPEMDLKPEHVVVISGAAGAVGSILVQIAKNVVGCKKVVGIAGGAEKCKWVKSLGADECIDYKTDDWADKLAKALPDYADRYFDNVGGQILNTMLGLVKRYGYICACGAISAYNEKVNNMTNWGEVIFNRITIKGYIVFDHPQLIGKSGDELKKWVQEGKVTNSQGETVVDTKFEDIPKTWSKLFDGGNQGKLITKLV